MSLEFRGVDVDIVANCIQNYFGYTQCRSRLRRPADDRDEEIVGLGMPNTPYSIVLYLLKNNQSIHVVYIDYLILCSAIVPTGTDSQGA